MERSGVQVLRGHVEPGRHAEAEVAEVLHRAGQADPGGASLAGRRWLAVSVPGSVVAGLPEDVLLGTPGGALDDAALRTVARRVPSARVDARWFPADRSGCHLLVVTTLTLSAPDGLPEEVAGVLDVDADRSSRVVDVDGPGLRFLRMEWRPSRHDGSRREVG